jgi:hypothetical protein
MKKLLIGGCSFSCSQKDIKDPLWIPWTDMLSYDYDKYIKIINTSESSFSQTNITEKILHQLLENDFDVDCVIIQWSAIGRSYATSINEFYKRVFEDDRLEFLPYLNEYMLFSDKRDWVTNKINIIDDSFYLHSLSQMIMIKLILDSKQIPYMMFWGWEQITKKIKEDNSKLFEKLYDQNFWRYRDNGGMLEYCTLLLNKKNVVIKNDFHPTTKSHKLFYENIIKPKIENVFDL